MKIEKLHFKNLNSLKGQFTIDFSENSPLGQSGVFAITGSIGAGKTTLLDAICVALFGRTHRLGVGRSGELMTRHTGECFAEVEFSVQNKRYRSKWSRHRAWKKADGKLRDAEMELAILDDNSNKLLTTGRKDVPLKVLEITDLDFDRFSRSIILAQGHFAAFLNANNNDRAELLEKMTGTEIYALISQNTFARFKKENEKLDRFLRDIEKLKIMPPEELENTRKAAEKSVVEITKKTEQLKQEGKKIQWLISIEGIQKSIIQSQTELETVLKDRLLNKKDLHRLAINLKASPLKSDYEIWLDKRKQVDLVKQEITQMKELIPLLEIEQKQLSEQKKDSLQKLERFKIRQETEIVKINLAKQKDLEIQTRQQTYTQVKKELALLKVDSEKLNQQQTTLNSKAVGIEKEISSHSKYIKENKLDINLEKELPLLEEQFRVYKKKCLIKTEKTSELSEINHEAEKSTHELKRLLKKQTTLETTHAELTEKKQFSSNQLQANLNEQTISDFEKSIKELEYYLAHLDAMIILAKQGIQVKSELKSARENLLAQQNLQKTKNLEMSQLVIQLKDQQELLKQLEEKRNWEIQIVKFEEDRKHLKKGEHCPLCGSTHHPWFEEVTIKKSVTEEALGKLKQEISKQQSLIEEMTKDIAGLSTGVTYFKKSIHDHEIKIDSLSKEWLTRKNASGISINLENMSELIEEQITHKKKLGELLKISQKNQDLINDIEAANQAILLNDQALNGLKLKMKEVEGKTDQLYKNIARLNIEKTTLKKEIKQQIDIIEKSLTPYRETFPKTGKEKATLLNFKQRSETIITMISNERKKSTLLLELREKISYTTAQLSAKLENQKKEEQNKILEFTILEDMIRQRKELMGDRSPDNELNQLKKQRQLMETDAERATETLQNKTSVIDVKKEVFESRSSEHQQYNQQFKDLNNSFNAALIRVGFENEKQFKDALLSSDKEKQLIQVKDDLASREARAQTLLDDAQARLSVENEKKLTEEKLEVIQQSSQQLEESLKQLQLDVGGLQETLRQQKEMEKEKSDHLRQIKNQQKELQKWSHLNRLIGSKDGMNFRRFAQGLTLDYLVRIANKNMQKLNPRYYLQRNKNEELGLEVVDTYQADITRPTETLSGGETFLTSLALALGLSNLAGRKAEINSLFLDEGFGTLDTESLETALATLDSLNSTGKTIGIISHIETLKERIPTQIKIVKLAGGVSTLKIVH